MTEQPKRKPGRPATGRQRQHELHAYLDEQEAELLEKLRRQLGQGASGVVRLALRALAKREGVE